MFQRFLLPLVAAATVALAASPAPAQSSTAVFRTPGDSLQNSYRFYPSTAPAIGLLVLLPAYGGGIDSFSPGGSAPSELPERLAGIGVATIVAVPVGRTLYADDRPIQVLDEIVAEVRAREGIPDRVVVGGFSAGGTGAVRYAQWCAARPCLGTAGVAGVFAVDAPLDFERLYRGEIIAIARSRAAPSPESRMIVETLQRTLGGSPDQEPDDYRERSPVLASAPDGGNARHLAGIPIRAYTEPDVQWWIEHRGMDYGQMNAVDAAALINILRAHGHTGAALITTTGRGYRTDGSRHPHAWSIVDEEELAEWIGSLLADPGAAAGDP
jgi:hypothetical protein